MSSDRESHKPLLGKFEVGIANIKMFYFYFKRRKNVEKEKGLDVNTLIFTVILTVVAFLWFMSDNQ